MREGYDGDDIFIMVEDEFQTVAQSYTAHLHHAEYKRLVKQAREAAPKALPEPTSPMSKEAKTRLRAAALEKKQKDTLQRVTGRLASEEEEEERVVDLWSGTSLAPLMANNSQQKRSLVGLEKIASSTKAGLGIARNRGHEPDIRDSEGDSDLDLESGMGRAARDRNESLTDIAHATSLSISKEASTHKQSSSANGIVRERLARSSSTSDVAVRRQSGGQAEPDINKPRPAVWPAANGLLRRKVDKEKEKKSRLEEVPMFII